jgi:nitrogen fixation NifU-like protein
MSLANDLYRETILDHYHNPRNQGQLENPTVEVEGVNPLCGDELTLYLDIDNDKVNNVAIKGKGCSINTASASMMSEAIKGESIEEAHKIINLFKEMMLSKEDMAAMPDDLEELEALRGVRNYPVRIKCALLPWNTLLEGINGIKSGNIAHGKTIKPHTVTTE